MGNSSTVAGFVTAEKLSFWYLTFLLSAATTAGNVLTVVVIYRSKRIRRLVNFFLSLIALNNLMLCVGNLAFVVALAFRDYADWQRFVEASHGETAKGNREALHEIRRHFMAACGGSQLWTLLIIVLAPNMVMKSRIGRPMRWSSLALLAPCVPYVLCALAAVADWRVPCGVDNEVLALVLERCTRLGVFALFWLAPSAAYLVTLFTRDQDFKLGSRGSRFSSTLSAPGRFSIRFYLPTVAGKHFRRPSEVWTTETNRVITLTKMSASLFWLPFYGSLAVMGIWPCSFERGYGDVTWSYGALLCAAVFPVVLFSCSARFRDGCNGKWKKERGGVGNGLHRRPHRKFSAPMAFFGHRAHNLQPREATVLPSVDKVLRTRSEDLSGKNRKTSFDSVLPPRGRLTRASDSNLNWNKLSGRVRPLPLVLHTIEANRLASAEAGSSSTRPSTLDIFTTRWRSGSRFLREAAIREYRSSHQAEEVEETEKRDPEFNFTDTRL